MKAGQGGVREVRHRSNFSETRGTSMILLVVAACEFNRDETGALLEYALLLGLIAVICLAAMSALRKPDQHCHDGTCLDSLVGRQTFSGVIAIARVGARKSWMESQALGRDSSRLIFLSARVVPGQIQKGSQVNIEDDFSRRR